MLPLTKHISIVFAKCIYLIKFYINSESSCMKWLLTIPRTFFQVDKLWQRTLGYIFVFLRRFEQTLFLNWMSYEMIPTYFCDSLYLLLLVLQEFCNASIIFTLPYQLFPDPLSFSTQHKLATEDNLSCSNIVGCASFYWSMLI